MNNTDFSGLLYNPDTGAFCRVSDPANEIRNVTKDGYATFKYKGRKYFAHRVAWFMHYGEWPVGAIDHINGIRCDNRIVNLRDVTKRENAHNQKAPQKGNRSGYLGVFWNPQRKNWTARIAVDGKRKFLGGHATPQAAHEAYLRAKMIYHPSAPVHLPAA